MKKLFALVIVIMFIAVQFVHSAPPKKLPHRNYPDPAYRVSPDTDMKDSYIKTILTTPWKSKALTPVKLKFGNGQPLIICENGKAKIKIIIPAKGAKHYTYYEQVAGEIKYFLDIANSLSFEIINDPGNTNIKGIYIGPLNNPISQGLYKKVAKGKDDSFIIKSFKNGVMIVGKDAVPKYGLAKNIAKKYRPIWLRNKFSARGTYMGTLDFLERFIGIRCYSPGRVGTYIPPLKGRTVKVPDVSYSDAPVYAFRNWSNPYQVYVEANKKYLHLNKHAGKIMSRTWGVRRRSSASSLAIGNHTDCIWQEFYMDKPEFFATRKDGSRMVGKKIGHSSQRCYSNEAGFQQHIKNIDNWYKYGDRTGKEYKTFTYVFNVPNDKYIYWMPNDGFPGCFCKQCKKDLAKYPDHLPPKVVQEYLYLIKLAKYAQKKWPGKVIAYNMYSQTEIPKAFLKKLPPNISITKVYNGYGLESFWKEKKYLDFAQNLIKDVNSFSSEKMLIWSHYPIKPREQVNIDMPALVPHYLTDFYRKNKKNIGGAYINFGFLSYAHDTYILYLYQALLWNPDIDPDAVLDEYCSLIYGPAAKEMLAYYKLLVKRWEDTKWSTIPDIQLYGAETLVRALPKSLYWDETYPTAVRKKLQELLRGAWRKTKLDSIYYERMQFMNEATAAFFKSGENFDNEVKMQTKSNKVADSKIKIDGNLQEWAGIKPIILKESMTGKDAKLKTEFFIANDEDNLYIAGKVYEPDKMILPKGKNLHDSPEIFGNDSIEMYFCPIKLGDFEAKFNNASRFYQIILNARGDVFDTHRPVYQKKLLGFTLDFEHAEKPMGKGWQFEIKIPFKSMDAMKPTPGMVWPANFYRNRKRNDGSERYYAWSPTMGESFFNSNTFGLLEFPRKVLHKLAFKPGGKPWDNKMTGMKYTTEYKNTKTILKGKISKDSKSLKKVVVSKKGPPMPLVVFSSYYDIKLPKPIIASMSIRYSGHGIKKIRFNLFSKSKDWRTMVTTFVPKGGPGKIFKNKLINFKVEEATGMTKRKRVSVDKLGVLKRCSIIVESYPGAEFTIESSDLIISEK